MQLKTQIPHGSGGSAGGRGLDPHALRGSSGAASAVLERRGEKAQGSLQTPGWVALE